jgi:hypothetical protein
MSVNINLLLRTDEESLKRKKRVKVFNFVAIASLIGVGLISLGIFISIQVIDPGSIRKEQADVLKKISALQGRQAKLFALNNRVENIDKIMTTRRDFSRIMSSLLTKIPGNLSVGNFVIDDKAVVIVGQSKSLAVIGEFINNLTDMVRKKEIIKSLTLNSLSLDEGKSAYFVSITSGL